VFCEWNPVANRSIGTRIEPEAPGSKSEKIVLNHVEDATVDQVKMHLVAT